MSRNTKQKEAILKALRKTADHPDARWIHQQVRRSLPHISLGTVYRDLKALAAENIVSVLNAGSGSRFDGTPDYHPHFRCQQCGAITNLDEPPDASMNKRIAGKYHMSVSFHRLEFFGLCAACSAASIPANNKDGD